MIIRTHSHHAIERNEYTVHCTRRYWFIMITIRKTLSKEYFKSVFIRASIIKRGWYSLQALETLSCAVPNRPPIRMTNAGKSPSMVELPQLGHLSYFLKVNNSTHHFYCQRRYASVNPHCEIKARPWRQCNRWH